MKIRYRMLPAAILVALVSCRQQPSQQADDNRTPKITFQEKEEEKRIDVLIDGRLFTAYQWPGDVYKPILYPVLTVSGNPVTRGFPIAPREGESQDHRHQVGNWLNYGNVNGSDFWGNGHTGARSENGGEIKHTGARISEEGSATATLTTSSEWVDASGNVLIKEQTDFHFKAEDSVRIIDRVTTLTSVAGEPVTFDDTKEGMFGIRVARELELPDEKSAATADTLVHGSPNGNYISSEGVQGTAVWGTRARWMDLYGSVAGEKVSLVICDHAKNINYPTYWHARGYGLFAANPLGVSDFTRGEKTLNFSLKPGESVTFRYRIILSSGAWLTGDQKNAYANDFAGMY